MAKMTFDEVLEMCADDVRIEAGDVLSSVLDRIVWVASWGTPGCMNDSSDVCATKADAIESCKFGADTGEGIPRGLVSALKRDGLFYTTYPNASYVYRIEKQRVRDILA